MQEKDLWCIVTVSSTPRGLTLEKASEMLTHARKNRRAQNLTGLTIFSLGKNLSLIEGEKHKVKLYVKETATPDVHTNVIKLYDRPLPYRFFEGHPMALKIIYPESFKKLDDFQEPGLREYLKAFLAEDHTVSAIFKDFIINNK